MTMGVVSVARDLVPIRPLRRTEALRVAELQATRFLAASGISEPPVSERIITELPRVQVERLKVFPHSAATHWASGRWLIVLKGSEARVRQRFSLAHELKHIIDHRFVDIIYNGVPDHDRHAWIEQVCDYFAGCLLMPRPWVKKAYYGGLQQLPKLAARFDVSQLAMQVRLDQIGLIEPRARCDRAPTRKALREVESAGSSALYHRQPKPVPV